LVTKKLLRVTDLNIMLRELNGLINSKTQRKLEIIPNLDQGNISEKLSISEKALEMCILAPLEMIILKTKLITLKASNTIKHLFPEEN
jgi:hypothetical protein